MGGINYPRYLRYKEDGIYDKINSRTFYSLRSQGKLVLSKKEMLTYTWALKR